MSAHDVVRNLRELATLTSTADGALGVMVGLEALRIFKDQTPPVTIKVVDWADEEGARFGRSLLGSAAAAGSLQVAEVEHLVDNTGVTLIDALKEHGVELARMHESHAFLKAIDAKPLSRPSSGLGCCCCATAGAAQKKSGWRHSGGAHPDCIPLSQQRLRQRKLQRCNYLSLVIPVRSSITGATRATRLPSATGD